MDYSGYNRFIMTEISFFRAERVFAIFVLKNSMHAGISIPSENLF
jgi:hypothetical protein